MVKKASLFTRLKERWRSGSGVRVERRNVTGSRSGRLSPQQVEDGEILEMEAESRLAHVPRERRSARKLSNPEEAALAMGEGFHELSTLMRGVQSRLDTSGLDLKSLSESLRSVPATGQAQLDTLRGIAAHMERNNEIGGAMVKSLGDLPGVLAGVKEALDRAAVTDERTARTLTEFQGTMGRIQGAMDQMVDHSKTQSEAARSLAGARETEAARHAEAMSSAVTDLRKTSAEGMSNMRKAQADQANRLTKVVEDNGKWHQALIVILGLVVVGLAAVLTVLILQ